MSSKLAIALGVLVVLTGITVLQFNAEETADKKGATVSVEIPRADKDAIDHLEVTAPGKEPVTLVKGEAGWQLTAPVSAKAADTAMKTALDKLAELEVTAVAATRAENHERLEVSEDKAIHVIAKHGEEVLSDLWIGAYLSGNTMVRKQGDVPVAAVKGSIRFAFDKEVKEWRDRKVLELDTAEVQALSLTSGGQTLRFVRDGEKFKQADGEAPIPEFDPAKVKSVVGSVTSLRAVDFAKPDVTPEQAGLDEANASVVTLEMASDAGPGQVVLRIGKKSGSNYYLQHEGDDVVYLISSFMAERLTKGAEAFKKDPAPAEPPPAAAAMPQGLPPGIQLPPGMQLPAGHP